MQSIIIYIIIIFSVLSGRGLAQGYICAVGGGSENYNDWSNAPYQWIVQKTTNKKIIILSYSDATAWLPDYFLSLGADTAYNRKISTRAIADDQATYDELITADGIFLKGGDQNQYITLWKGTKTELALKEIFQRGGVIAGTSAGAMVLGEFNFTARYGSITSKESLNNPFAGAVDVDTTFLNLRPNVLFDTHFIERGRFGRLIAMVFKVNVSFNRDILGVGIDDRTAICIDSDGIGTVTGSGAVSIFRKDENTRFTSGSDGYIVENLKCDQLTAGWAFDFVNRKIHTIPPTARNSDTSRAWEYPLTDFFLTGSNTVSTNLISNIPAFLNSSNAGSVLVISHPGFQSNLTQLTSYLGSQSYTYDTLLLNSALMNDPVSVQKIYAATAIIFCGDSLSVLSLLRDSSQTLAAAFYQKIRSNTPLFFSGKSGKTAGDVFTDNTDSDIYAAYRGRMTNKHGLSIFGDLIFQPQVFESSDFAENRTASVLWGLMLNRKRLGIYLDGADRVVFNSSDNTISGSGSIPFIIVDARNTTKVDSSIYRAGSSIAPRQSAAMNNLRYSVSKNNHLVYAVQEGKFLLPSDITTESPSVKSYFLGQNYPNPFNPATTIIYTIPASMGNVSVTSLRIYDVLGRETATLVNEEKPPGTHQVTWAASGYPSGIYFYRLQVGAFKKTKKMILMR